jgi:hypothetical protein
MEAEPTVSLTRIWTSLSNVGLWKALRTSWIEGLRLELSILGRRDAARSFAHTAVHARRLRRQCEDGAVCTLYLLYKGEGVDGGGGVLPFAKLLWGCPPNPLARFARWSPKRA